MNQFLALATETPPLIIGLLAAACFYGMGIGPAAALPRAHGVALRAEALVAFSTGWLCSIWRWAPHAWMYRQRELPLQCATMFAKHADLHVYLAPLLIYALRRLAPSTVVLRRSSWLLGCLSLYCASGVGKDHFQPSPLAFGTFRPFMRPPCTASASTCFEHLTMFFTSVLMFWPILSRSELAPRRPLRVVLIYLSPLSRSVADPALWHPHLIHLTSFTPTYGVRSPA